jgi:hypothetical protein
MDNSSNDSGTLLNFAMHEYLEIAREHSRLRFLTLGIMGAVTPVIISFLFSVDADDTLKTWITSLIFLILLFVYIVLAIIYAALSRRYDVIVKYMQLETGSEFKKYFAAKGATESYPMSDWVWPTCNFAIFILPSIISLIVSAMMSRFSVYWIVIALVYVALVSILFLEWARGLEERRNIPRILSWIPSVRDHMRRGIFAFLNMNVTFYLRSIIENVKSLVKSLHLKVRWPAIFKKFSLKV